MEIKESKELLKAILVLAKVSAEVLKDGVQVQDLVDGYVKLAGDAEKKAVIEAALANIGAVPAELKDLNLSESVELLVVVAQEIPSLLEAFKPKAV